MQRTLWRDSSQASAQTDVFDKLPDELAEEVNALISLKLEGTLNEALLDSSGCGPGWPLRGRNDT